tara:strand:+ start:1222 stop:2649 length:1428 start_codon:yes stop_codon:yes gene_type:complete
MNYQIKNICCIGAGYVGGPSMAVIADKCTNTIVNVVDLNQERIDLWNSKDLSKLPIYEPGLKDIIKRRRGKNLYFSTEIKKHISEADMIFISVNTPTKSKGIGAGEAIDLKWVEASSRQISQYAKGKTIVVEKSTLPVRTAETIKKILNSTFEKANVDSWKQEFYILSNPEFLAEGTAINDLENPDRILIGGDDDNAIKALENIYSSWINKDKIIKTDLWSAELSKLIANAFLAQRISSINSISALCEVTGADINEVANAIGKDKRIGKFFLNSGPGFGGSCFKKDILNLVYICKYYGLQETANYWQKVIEINDWQQERISNLIINKLFGTVVGKRLAILGFSFKKNTNDTRESPAIKICKDLIEEGAKLNIYDPKVKPKIIEKELNLKESIEFDINSEWGEWKFVSSIEESALDSDALIFLTEWEEFRSINWQNISEKMRNPKWIFDTRSICLSKEAQKFGFNIWMLGEGKNNP